MGHERTEPPGAGLEVALIGAGLAVVVVGAVTAAGAALSGAQVSGGLGEWLASRWSARHGRLADGGVGRRGERHRLDDLVLALHGRRGSRCGCSPRRAHRRVASARPTEPRAIRPGTRRTHRDPSGRPPAAHRRLRHHRPVGCCSDSTLTRAGSWRLRIGSGNRCLAVTLAGRAHVVRWR